MEQGPDSPPVVVARIVKPHGIRGELVLESFTDVEGRLEKGASFLLVRQGRVLQRVEVESSRLIRGRAVMKFSGVDSRTDAERMRGLELAIPSEEAGPLPPDRFFIHDLIGMTVCLMDGKEIGCVDHVVSTGGVDLLEVGKILIPFASDICVEVDMKLRRIRINPPEGLLQLNAN